MALTEKGFSRRTYDEIVQDKINKATELFGADIDTSEYTPLGKFIRLNAYDQSIAEEEIEALYYSIFPNTATGVSLDRLCPFVGISRSPATSARFAVKVTGTAGTVIPYGFLVGTESLLTFYNNNEAVIDDSGQCIISVDCEQTGIIGNVNPSEIVEVVNPTAGIESVVGVGMLIAGTETEDDVTLRSRFEQAREGSGSCNESAIRAALLRVPTVTSASVIVNESNTTDASGRPAHSFECFVAGGENYHQEIAETIFEKKPIGIGTHGSISEAITDESGTARIIKFSHTASVTVYVKVNIKTELTFEGDVGISDIKENIKTVISGLGVGETVVLSSLYGLIHAVNGVTEVTSLLLSTDNSTWKSANITTKEWEKAVCQSVEVTVE